MEAELTAERKKNEDLMNRLKYVQADLENYRKRVDKEMKEASEASLKLLITRLLAVGDELDLAYEHADKDSQRDEMREGIGMVRKNLDAALQSVGVERITSVGMPFDPTRHEAVERVGGATGESDFVVEELRPGFTFRGQLLRPSMVKVGAASKHDDREGAEHE